MIIQHPVSDYQGMPPENVFFAYNDQKIQLGTGYVVQFTQGELYPDQPLHIFTQIDSQPSARCLLFGALIARAGVIRTMAKQPARLYTQIDGKNIETLRFFEQMGFKNDDSEDLYGFQLPYGRAAAPVGFEYWQSPLGSPEDELQLLARINRYRIQPVSRDYLTLWRQQEHFLALAYYRQGQIACECIFTGIGRSATLLSIYTVPELRRQHLASQLLDAASYHLREQGVTTAYTHIFRRNTPQNALIRHLNGQFLRQVNYLPGINMIR